MIKILCISNLYEMTDTTWNGIEIGKTYDAVKENKNSYFIERRIGVLYKKKSVMLAPIFGGGDQEQGIRSGTENLPEILKLK